MENTDIKILFVEQPYEMIFHTDAHLSGNCL